MYDHNELGKWGEEIAQKHLLLQGYHIYETNWRCGHHEIDIIAEKLGYIIFFEVKTRQNLRFGTPEESIGTKKIRYLISAANAYMRFNQLDMPCQFDVISIVGSPNEGYHIQHIKQAFDGNSWDDSTLYENPNVVF